MRALNENSVYNGLTKAAFLLIFQMLMSFSPAYSQGILTGKVTGKDGMALSGASISVIGTNNITITDTEGRYSLRADPGALIEFSYVGYASFQIVLRNETELNIPLVEGTVLLNEVVVVGYGTTLRKDVTGAVASVSEKDFNKGNFISPDQLIQGRIAGVQISNSSGQPGVAATIKIRGNSALTGTGQPLFVVDGVPLSGTTARPNTDDINSFGTTSPAGNPLNFLNPSDIASIDVLKDASAGAIYGSRAAYGVVLITTKKGQAGEPKLDFSFSTGLASIQNKIKVLDATQFRSAMKYYDVNPANDKGGDSDGLASILRSGKQQNYSVGISGGNTNGKYRLSFGYYDQEGIILKSELKKYNGSLSANLKFLQNKRLGMDINLIASQYIEEIPFLRNDRSLVGDALVWNPTDSLRKSDGSLNIAQGSGYLNPLAISELYNDNSKVSTVLASLAPYYEFTDWLEFKTLISINYGTGVRRNSTKEGLYNQGPNSYGSANIYNNENYTDQITSTLTFHKDVLPLLNVTAIAGFEYQKFTSQGSSIGVTGPSTGFGNWGLDYTNYIQYSNPTNRSVSSFAAPLTELQSYFGRTVLNYNKKYLLTVTFRADGSTKFGQNNKYGYFPSFSSAWVLSEEDFLRTDFINYLKLRIGWGKTGNQEFPAGASTALYGFTNNGGYAQVNNPNPNLKWQTDEQFNVGLDFTILNNKISGTVDYFQKTTTDLLYPSYAIQPAPPLAPVTWLNLDGKIQNKGLEATIKMSIIDHADIDWDLGINATFIENNVSGLLAPVLTGSLHGGGMSGVTVQEIRNGAPINSFVTRKYLGIDQATGLSIYQDNGNTFYNVGNPNPTKLLGINSTFRFKKFTLNAYMYGAFGHSIYNNTANSTLNVANISYAKNIPLSTYQSLIKESLANYVTASSRFIENGDYLKLGNATLTYNLGNMGKAFKQTRIYVTGQNLFTLTNYSGFNPEINVDKSVNSVPSLGIDYQAYPAARTIIIGINFSL